MEYKIEITPLAIESLSKVKDRREQQRLKKRIEKLAFEPDKQGKALSGKLKELSFLVSDFNKCDRITEVDQDYGICFSVNQL